MSLKHVLLTLLDRKPGTGYELVGSFDSAVGYFWNASHQQVYRELASLSEAKLVKFKLVQQDDKPDKKIYSLSSTGKAELQRWLENPLKKQKIKDLLLVKLVNTNHENVAFMRAELERSVVASKEIYTTYLDIEKAHYSAEQLQSLPAEQVMIYAALRKGILSIEAHLAWLEEVEKLLKKTFALDKPA